ncbi:hypothetical protein J2W48_002181 [Flavobacterium piscis]|uniref:Uncharacterized protein n=1 Tax=Flavobacterium piscis TaxID=1114874 RepID=A0ABU1Y9U0_9FLAO|nr:hypothetical protein [Flavobacterium piscis]
MKIFAIIIVSYFSILTSLPTVRVIKMHLSEKCNNSCGESKSKKDASTGCPKQKCILTLNFSSGSFIVFNSNYTVPKNFISFERRINVLYNNNLIDKYNSAIWQPPENMFLVS